MLAKLPKGSFHVSATRWNSPFPSHCAHPCDAMPCSGAVPARLNAVGACMQGNAPGAVSKSMGKMHLIDLAGSERINKSGVQVRVHAWCIVTCSHRHPGVDDALEATRRLHCATPFMHAATCSVVLCFVGTHTYDINSASASILSQQRGAVVTVSRHQLLPTRCSFFNAMRVIYIYICIRTKAYINDYSNAHC